MRKIFTSVSIMSAMALLLFIFSPELALAGVGDQIQQGANSAAGADNDPSPGTVQSTIENIINILTVIVGVAAVIMIIVGGFRYITSGGDPQKVTSAKNTLVYAIIGLIVVALAQIIVKFVLTESNEAVSSATSQDGASGGSSSPSRG